MSDTDHRSASRGRQAFSTGRGGAGNIRQPSVSTDTRPDSGPDDFSQTRGREINVPVCNPSKSPQPYSTGRGGAGNMRSPSRDPQKKSIKEEEVIEEHKKAQVGAPVSSGRGGLGNISRSRVREAATGNIASGKSSLDGRHENDIKHDHFIGHGGNANKTTKHDTPVELHHHIASGDGHQFTGPGEVAKDTT